MTMTKGRTIEHLGALLRESRRITVLTGAGMSTESGIPDFRSSGGLYTSGVSEEVFDIRAFDRDPAIFYTFARAFLRDTLRAQPNAGHRALAALARTHDKEVHVCTQNIDSLHQEAGSPAVYPLHGTLQTARCRTCGERIASAALWPEIHAGRIPRHGGCGGVMKPDIVFFGEPLPPDAWAASERAARTADLFVVAGTSLAVYPAAGLPALRAPACRLVMINRTPTPLDGEAELVLHTSIADALAQAVGGGTAPEKTAPLPPTKGGRHDDARTVFESH